jgi:DNA-binding NarL/FixJ family response regulator
MSIRVVLADDQALVRGGFRMMLAAEDGVEVVGEAGDGQQAIEQARALRPDVVVMDIAMPRVDGVEATREILATVDPAPRVLIVTTFDIDEYVFSALRAGAAGFLLKNAPPEQLVDAITVLAQGDSLLSPSITRRLIEDYASRGPSVAEETAKLDELTPREHEVLRLVAKGLSNAEIAEELVVSQGTAKTHVASILMKLGLRDRVQAVVLAYELGVVRPGD